MRIGVDATSCWNRRGFGRFARELLRAMMRAGAEHEWVLVTDRRPEAGVLPNGGTIVHVQPNRRVTESAVAGGRRSLRDLHRFRHAVASQDLDVFFFPAVYSYFPLPRRIPQVVCFHDTIAEDHPEVIFASRWERLAWWAKVRAARRNARRVMTVSEASKGRLVDRLRIAPSRIDLVSEGAAAIFQPTDRSEGALRSRFLLPERYLLAVGGLSPHKNLTTLLDAFALVAAEAPCGLAIVGDPAAGGFLDCGDSLQTRIRSSALLSETVTLTGYVTDAELADLYRGAVALAFPSLAEGFGLPALEAMACGTPVLASHAGSLPEVVGDAGLYFDPRDVKAMASQMLVLLGDLRLQRDLRERALARATAFTWERAADQALRSLQAARS